MKKLLLYLMLLILPAIIFAQTKLDSAHTIVRGIIKINPLQLFVGELRLYYEKPLKHNISFEISTGFIYGAFPGALGEDFSQITNLLYWGAYGFSERVGMKFFLNRKYDHHKFFINPLLFGNKINDSGDSGDFVHINSIGFQILFGYKFTGKIPIEIYWGYGYRKIFVKYGFQSLVTNHTYTKKYSVNYSTPQTGINICFKIK